jgi:hypothetical protein
MADGRGISYYIPPEFRRMGQSAMDLLSAIDPAQGIMRGMAASGRAFDSDLPADERRAAAIEAGVETLFPVGMIGMGAAAKQPAKAVLMDILTPTGATKDIAEDTLADPSRRKFLQGAAAAVPVAAVAPDVITDVMTKATKAGGRAAINPLDMAMANIKELRRQIDEGYAIVNEVLDNPRSSGPLPDEVAAMDDANKTIQTAEFEIIDEAFDAIIGMKPDEFSEAVRTASDDALEAIIEPQYESIMGNQSLVDDGENSVTLAQEVHRRGMHLAKDENGIDRFPNARAYAEDFYDAVDGLDTNIILPKTNVDDGLLDSIGVYRDDGNLNMARQTPPDIEEDILQLKLTELRRQIEQADRVMRADGKTTKEIDEFKAQKRREMFELQNLPPDMDDFYAKGGLVSGVGSLNRRARDMFRGPRGIATLSRFAQGGKAESKQSFNEMMSSLQNDLSEMSSSEFESAYGQSKSEARDTLDMLIVQRYHGPSYEDGIPSAYRTERDAQLAQERMMGEIPPEPTISETTGMVGVDEDGNIVEYGTSYDIAEFAEGGAAIATEDELSNMRTKVMEDYGFDPVSVAIEEGVDPELLLRVMYTENKGRQGPRSEKGAIGLMQLMPGTAEELGVDPYDPEDNTRGGARYLAQMLARFESIPLALAAYNAGPGNVTDYGGIPPFAETQNYVRQIAPALTGADIERQIEDTSEAFVMSQPVAAEGEYSPVPMLRPFNLPTYTGSPGTSPIPQLRPQEPEETPQGIPSVAGVIPGRRTNLFEKYGGIASLTNP